MPSLSRSTQFNPQVVLRKFDRHCWATSFLWTFFFCKDSYA